MTAVNWRDVKQPIRYPWQWFKHCIVLLPALLLAPAGALAQQANAAIPNWTLATVKNPLTQQEECMLQSAKVSISDGYGEADVTLLISERDLAAVTTSTIDASFNDLRLVIDEGNPIQTKQVVGEKTVVFEQDMAAIVAQFKKGYAVKVYLRFWPTWPATESFPAQFSLRGFTKAYEGLANCHAPVQ
ncbi:MAG: hypothetical protein H6970_02115 [Gammaproteobacteria bacterium]|nr:hypothetical protein [Gammaproteobacteria bacterium]MCP5423856.1 hypothetical protein [Gammaproteobacteria bacterium]